MGAWGANTNGQIGHAVRQCFPEPVEIPLGEPIARVRAGWQCTVYISESGRPIVCGGIQAEGPSVADVQDGPGGGKGGPQAQPTVMDMVQTTGMEVMTDVITDAAVGAAHGVMVCYDGSVRGWGYNRQMQAIGDITDETFVKPGPVDGIPEDFKGHSVAVCGAQSYAILKPPGQ